MEMDSTGTRTIMRISYMQHDYHFIQKYLIVRQINLKLLLILLKAKMIMSH